MRKKLDIWFSKLKKEYGNGLRYERHVVYKWETTHWMLLKHPNDSKLKGEQNSLISTSTRKQ